MPKKRRRISAFIKILTALTVVCAAIVAGGYYVVRSVQRVELTPPPPVSGCTLTAAGETDELEVEQAANAATISGVAFGMDLPPHAVVVAYATVWQESKFRNIGFGDRDSVGLFQQRPSQEWGDPEHLMDPVYSSRAFYERLAELSGYQDMPVYEAAQAVQRSADGFAYDQHESRSRTMAEAFTGAEGPAVTCWYDTEAADAADVEGARAEMDRVFSAGQDRPADGAEPQTGDRRWAMALWAVANAEEYGLTTVEYGGWRWTAADGIDGWTEVGGENAAPTAEDAGESAEIVLR
ncbi:hypothetical protein [Marinactinospora rubrisoli]|uniref:Uncharacterized protein n=1 Tax=Marinactinospora rubrisoli TaxID=2715399 RepID=A0ABW2KC71_9ACTN